MEKGTATKARIRRVAAELFAARGFHGTGLSELEEAVGLGRGALYYHIKNKHTLLYEISIAHVIEMVTFGEQLLESRLSVEEKFRRLSRRLMTTISANLPELTVFFREAHVLTGSQGQHVRELRERFEQVWLQILRQGAEEDLWRHADQVSVKAILGMHNYSYLWLRPDGELPPEEIADRFCDLLLHGLLHEPLTTTDAG